MDLRLHPRQSFAFRSTATEILYGGAAGGGKSHFLRVLALVLAIECPGLQIYLFRRLSTDLEKNHLFGPTGLLALCHDMIASGFASYNSQRGCMSFANGAKIWLCHCQYEKNKFSYQGAEIHVLLVDELTHFTEGIYRFLRGRLRMPDIELPDRWAPRLPMAVAGSNPGNIGHTWVKAMFIDPHPPEGIHQADEDDGGMLRQYIPAKLADNPSIRNPREYASRLAGLGSPQLVQAMLDGSWDIVAGGMFADVWDQDTHVLDPFEIPDSWRVDRSFDWGSSKPFSVAWWAEADGTEATRKDGTTFCPPRGTIIRIAEYYGWNGTPNQGLRMLASEIAREIITREEQMGLGVYPGPADSAIYTNENGNCIADDMAECGVEWTKANKSPGSRKNGWELMRSRMKASFTNEDPALYVFSSCRQFIRTIPVLPRSEKDPDDIDTNSEDHIADEARYRVLDEGMFEIQAVDLFG